ncbi:hypothetical protein [Nonomuraea typhae]|uniref:hypothetical protein n=1 Tax=Nonomuraea typhae TaxID=2603600 RepID=UPI0012FAA5EE|nr:hypothetical protein [Nonomuraea typhae]
MGPDDPLGETVTVSYLPDGDDYIVLASHAETTLTAALHTASAATLTDQQIAVDITMLTGPAQQGILLRRLLKHASVYERHEVTRHRQVPIARLTPRRGPVPGCSIASPGLP